MFIDFSLFLTTVMDINSQKNELRRIVKQRKKEFSNEKKLAASTLIFEQLEQLPEFIEAQTVLLYWSMKDEVQTHDFVLRWYQKKNILLPIVEGDVLRLRKFTGMDCMVEGKAFGIMEPHNGPEADASEIDLGVIPGVAFDKSGNRLGRGKAYYDKLLSVNPFSTVGVCFSIQLFDSVPADSLDIPMDRVLFA